MTDRRRILLIEDSPTQAERLRRLFDAEGWEVTAVLSAEAAFQELNRAHPDLIVVDYYLPGMKGDEFCREIRMNVNLRGIPILMLTVGGLQDAETHGLESGADDYLAKSTDTDILLLRVRALLRKSDGPSQILDRSENFLSQARLLAVDDSPTYLHYLTQELASESYVVEKATAGEQGLQKLRKEHFDCVLVDLEMPGLNGIEVCRHIAEFQRTSHTSLAVVMLTGYEEKKYMTQALEAGADDFIGKSSDISILKARIRALLRRKFLMEENRGILEEFKRKELEAAKALAEKEAAEARALLAEKLEQANRKLQEALEVTRTITQNAAEALFMTGQHGRITFLNPAAEQMFGFTNDEMMGRVLHEIIHSRYPDGRPFPIEECPLNSMFMSEITVTGKEDVFFRKDGRAVHVSCSYAPILQDGRLIASVLVVHDISERKRAEERLRQSQKLESIGLLAGGIAHDFNNLLTAIMGAASLVEDAVPPGARTYVDAILEASQKGANLTRQLLAYAGKGQFVIQSLDVSKVAREIIALARLSLLAGIRLRLELPDGLPLVSADPGQIEQVFMNLILNAGEAIGLGDDGWVRVSTGTEVVSELFVDSAGTEVQPGCYVVAEVTDSGCGMDEQTKSRIFDPFFSTKFTGRGLGLAAVSGIVRSLRGSITITSTPGSGSTFRVLFPAAANG